MKLEKIGMIRNVDALGRVVLPCEMRRALDILEGDPLAVEISNGRIVLTKYQELQKLESVCELYLQALSSVCGTACAVSSMDYILATRNISISYEQPMSQDVKQYIRCHKTYLDSPDPLFLFESGKYPVKALFPIGSKALPAGAVLLLGGKEPAKEQLTCAKLTAAILTMRMETVGRGESK